MPASADARIGTELAGYRLEGLIGRGGMGVVFRARDLALDRDVALKLLAPHLADDISFRERFLKESRVAASLEHPNVVPIHDAGEIDAQLYIAMRLVDGTDLKAVLRGAPLEPAHAVHVLEQVAGALDAAHARGLVHRDVKPSNVLLDEGGHVYLADFGLSRFLGDAAVPLGPAKSLGTADYVAPEQIRGEDVDGRADVYALGCMLYECLAGEPPFGHDTEAATLFAQLEEEPPVVPGLEEVLPKGLAKEPNGRYATCSELIDAAREALGIAEPKRSRWPIAVAVVGVALIVATLAAFFLTRGAGVTAPVTPAGDGRVVRIDPATGKRLSAAAFGQDLSNVTIGPGAVWLASLGTGEVAQLDPGSGRVTRAISVSAAGSGPSAIAMAEEGVWIVAGGDDKVRLYDARRRQFAAKGDASFAGDCACPGVDLPAAALGRQLWTINPPQNTLERFTEGQGSNGDVGTSDSTLLPAGGYPTGLALGRTVVWVVTSLASPTLFKVDQISGRVIGKLTLPPETVPSAVAIGAGGVWVADLNSDVVLRIEGRLRINSSLSQREALAVTKRIPVGRAPTDIAIGHGWVWVANDLDGTISRIDPRTNRVDTFAVGPYPEHLAVGDGSVWVALDPP